MPSLPKPEASFSHEALERDIEKLSQEIRELKSVDRSNGREFLKQTLHGQFFAPSDSSGSDSVTKKTNGVLPGYLKDAPAETKFAIEKLIDFAWHKGIMSAIKLAKEGDPLVLDAFHDALTDKLYDELVSRGHLK
jgi:hypothetical protein